MANPRFQVAPPPVKKQGEGGDHDSRKPELKPRRRDDDPFIHTEQTLTLPSAASQKEPGTALGAGLEEPLDQPPAAAAPVDTPGVTQPPAPQGEVDGPLSAASPAVQVNPTVAPPAPVDGQRMPVLSPGPLLGPEHRFQTRGGHTPAPDRLVALMSKVDSTRASIPAAPAKEDVGIVTHTLNFPVSVARDLVKAGKPTTLANNAIRWAVSAACQVHPTEFTKVFEVLKEARRRPSLGYPLREGKAKHTTAVLTQGEDQAVGILAGKAGLTHAALCEAATYLYLYSVALPPAEAAGTEG